MSQAAPLIYSPRIERVRLSPVARLLALAISLGSLALLVVASQLHPDPSGMGTHTQLGLDQCQFAARLGIPCPSCGMTTSFAWFVRGNLVASFYIQPMGAVLAALAVVAFWTGAYIALTGRAVYRLLWLIPSRYYVQVLLGWALIAWAWKIFIHLRGMDGWAV